MGINITRSPAESAKLIVKLTTAVKNYAAHLYEHRMAATPAKLIEKPMGIYHMVSQFRAL